MRARLPLQGRWLLATLAVLALAALFVRLAVWQFGRLAEKRDANARTLARLSQPVLALDGSPVDAAEVELRRATVRGAFDFDREVVLRNRTRNELPGVHVLTPLRISAGDAAILVDRGWLPYELAAPESRAAYHGPAGEVVVSGILRRSMARPGPFAPADPPLGPDLPRLDAWHRVDIPRIQEQTPYPLLPVYLEQEPSQATGRSFPIPQPEIGLDEGRHLFFALQWLAFAAILLGIYAARCRRRGRPKSARSWVHDNP